MPLKAKAAYIEEEDPETGKTVTRSSAKKQVEIKYEPSRRSSQKENENPSGESRHSNAGTSSQSLKRVESKQKAERRMSSSSTASPKKSFARPPSAHKNTNFPHAKIVRTQPINIIQEQPQVRAITQSHARPSSFHEGTYNYPPISNSAYYVPQQNSLIPAPSYPSPSPIASYMYANGNTYHSSGGSVLPPPPFRQDYSTPAPQLPSRTLEERLGGDPKGRRRSSVYYTAKEGYDGRGYDSAYERYAPIVRKSSLRKTQEQSDRERMPPPPTRRRVSDQYVDEDSLDDESFAEPRYRHAYKEEEPPPRPRRPSMNRHSATYAYGTYDRIESETSGARRRPKSYYAVPSAPANNYKEKLKAADNYQTSVGGPETRLTAESLKKASRRAHPPSSHSTRSSGSRDESERQRSSVTTRTTGTTRTGAGDEDITIKLKGQGKIKIAGAEIDYDKDTELNIRRTGGNVGGGGSQRSSDYGASEDRRDRRDRASDRSRLSSNVRIPRDRQGYF